MPRKLSDAQLSFLRTLAEGPATADPSYAPARRLTELGLALRVPRQGRIMRWYEFSITPAGLAALKDNDHG